MNSEEVLACFVPGKEPSYIFAERTSAISLGLLSLRERGAILQTGKAHVYHQSQPDRLQGKVLAFVLV